MGCSCKCFSKVLLVLLNILVGLIGFVLLAVGIFVQFAGEYVKKYIQELADELKEQGFDQIDLTNMYEDMLPILNGIAIPLIVIGAFLFILSFFGCCGVCCNKQVCLLIFSIVVTIIFVGMLAGILYIVIGANHIKGQVKKSVKEEIIKKYVGIESTNAISLFMNVLQIEFKCCGVDNFKDFKTCDKWKRDVTYSTGVIKYKGKLLIPIACCKMKGEFPSVEARDNTCPILGINSYKNEGCFEKLDTYFRAYVNYFYVILCAPLVFMLIMTALGWYLYKKQRDTDSGLDSAAKMV